MTDPENLSEGHEWRQAREWDRLAFYCPACDIHIPSTAGDTQAGILLFCPECDDRMEYNMDWRDD